MERNLTLFYITTVFIKLSTSIILILSLVNFQSVFSATTNIAVLETVSDDINNSLRDSQFKQEIIDLLEGEHDVIFTSYLIEANDSPIQARNVLLEASNNNEVDIVLVLDVAANQILGLMPEYIKPTFLPFIFNARLSGVPLDNDSSGKRNLNYITFNFDFETELQSLKSVAEFKQAVLVTDSSIRSSIDSKVIEQAIAQAKKANVELSILNFNGNIDLFVNSLPDGTQAILYGFLPSLTNIQIIKLIDSINDLGLPSFSLTGEEIVKEGALATNIPVSDTQRMARRIALHIQDVLLGEKASQLPVLFDSYNQLIINMATSREIHIAPSFDVLSEAKLLNEFSDKNVQVYSLTKVARQAITNNLSLTAQRLSAQRANESIKEVRGDLLPQITSSLEYSDRKETNTTRSGIVAESSIDGTITFTQSLYTEELWAAYDIEKFAALSEKELVREVELDITQDAVNSYLDVLREKTLLEQERFNLEITRRNLRLAKNRVEIGTESAADLFRWESELANAKQAVLDAFSSFEQQKQLLNQILNRPIDEEFQTTVEKLDNPDLLISDKRINALIKNIYDFNSLTDFLVEKGLERSPELKQIEANLSASRRQLKSDQRAYWVPDLNLTGEYSNNLEENRDSSGIDAAANDWSVGVELSLPLFEGGSRGARVSQSQLDIAILETDLFNTKNLIEQRIRNNLEAAHASYNSIPLAKAAEEFARQNYELIADSYTRGAINITDVLDAQETLIDASEASMNAVYDFLIDLMNVQRDIGAYDFFLTDSQRLELTDELIQRVNRQSKGSIYK